MKFFLVAPLVGEFAWFALQVTGLALLFQPLLPPRHNIDSLSRALGYYRFAKASKKFFFAAGHIAFLITTRNLHHGGAKLPVHRVSRA